MATFRESLGKIALIVAVLTASASAHADPRALTLQLCAACHGEDGIARDVEVPHLAGQNEAYLANQMLAFRSGRRQHREMRLMARELDNAEIAAIAAWYASLPPR